MSKLPLSLAAVILAAAVPLQAAMAPGGPARISALFAGAGPAGLGAFEYTPGQLPPAPAVFGRAVRAQQNGALITQAMWDASKPLDPVIAKWVAARIPGMDASKVREATYDQVAAVVGECARRGYSNLDLFTDAGLRTDVAYYLSQDTVARLFRDFDMSASLQSSGKTNDGQTYHMVAIVMGRGAVNILYDWDGFEFDSGGKTYKANSRIVQTIQGDGTLGVSGLWVHVWPFWPRIERLVKLGGGRMRVETDKGSRDMDDNPIRRR